MEAKATPMISRLKMIRREMGLTQKAFATVVGVNYGLYTYIEQGTRNITDRTIRLICEKCKVREQWLRFGEGRMFVDARLDAFEQFVTVFQLDVDQQKHIAEYVHFPISTLGSINPDLDVAKRNIARLVKAIDNGKAGRAAS